MVLTQLKIKKGTQAPDLTMGTWVRAWASSLELSALAHSLGVLTHFTGGLLHYFHCECQVYLPPPEPDCADIQTEKRNLSMLALRHWLLWKWFIFTFRMSEVYHEATDRLQTKLERDVPWDCIHRHEHVRRALSLERGVVSTSWTLSRGQRRRWRKFGKGDTQHTTRRTGDGLLARERPEEHHDGTFEEGGLTYFTSSREEAGEQDVDTHGSHLEVGFGSMYAHILKKKDF